MDELIAFLRSKTHLGRFTEPEIRDLIGRMDEGGWEIVRKGDGVIVEPEGSDNSGLGSLSPNAIPQWGAVV